MVNRERVVNELLKLVQIDSPSMHERDIADYLIKKFTDLGLEVYEDKAGETLGNECVKPTGNLIVKLNGTMKNAPVIFFSSHMDTVEPGRGVKPIIKDDVIYSDGTTILGSDDKSGIASIIEAIQIIKENDIPHGDVEFIFTVGEEIGLIGSTNLDKSKIKAKFGYVLDSDGDAGTIVTKAPSQYRIKASIIGKAAHAGMCPEEGINAIYVASKAISQLNLGRIDEETTTNIGIIEGGKATNIIPDLVNIEGESRSIDPEKLEIETNKIVDTLEKVAKEFGAKAKVDRELLYPRMKLNDNDLPVKIASEAARAIGQQPLIVSTGGGSDANVLNGYGIPTVNLGVGMSKVHSVEEYIKIDNLVLNVKLILEIIKKTANK